MRRVALLVTGLLAGLSLAAPANADPTSNGVIRGRVINGSTGEPQPGVKITLSSATRDSGRVRRWTARTDERGLFRFGDLRTGRTRAYAIDASHDGGLFAGGVLSIPAQRSPAPVIDTRLRVWNTVDDPSSILVRRNSLFLTQSGDNRVGVVESVTVFNASHRAYIGRGAGMAGGGARPGATLGFALPAGGERDVRIIDSEPIDVPRIVATDYGFATTVAIPPGRTSITFGYSVASDGGGAYDLSKTILYPTSELSLYTTEPLEAEGDRLRPAGEVTIGDQRYSRWSTVARLDAGDRVLTVVVAEGGSSGALAAGAAAIGALVVAGTVLAAVRRRRASADVRAGARRPRPALAPTRQEVVAAIAKLDLAYESGGFSEGEWKRRRALLKDQLGAEPEREHAR